MWIRSTSCDSRKSKMENRNWKIETRKARRRGTAGRDLLMREFRAWVVLSEEGLCANQDILSDFAPCQFFPACPGPEAPRGACHPYRTALRLGHAPIHSHSCRSLILTTRPRGPNFNFRFSSFDFPISLFAFRFSILASALRTA